MKPAKNKTSLLLFSLHFPALVLIVALGLFTTLVYSSATRQSGSVLSKGSGSDGSEDDDHESDDDDRDEDDDEDDDNSGSSNSGSGSSGSGSSGTSGSGSRTSSASPTPTPTRTRETVVNDDGTTSQIRTETKDGRTRVEIRTFDQLGNKIRVEKFRSQNGHEETRVSTYDETGSKLTDLRLRTEDGKELEFRIKEGELDLQRVRYDADKQELIVRFGDEDSAENPLNRLRLRVEGDSFILTRQGVDVVSRYPLIVDDIAGTVSVATPSGELQLNALPDSILERTSSSSDLELELSDDQLVYILTGTTTEKLFGLFSLQIPSALIYDAGTGEFLRNDQTFVTKILDLFSF